jgi:hypothetical protein
LLQAHVEGLHLPIQGFRLLWGESFPGGAASPANDEVNQFGILGVKPDFLAQKTRLLAQGSSPDPLVFPKESHLAAGGDSKAEVFDGNRLVGHRQKLS